MYLEGTGLGGGEKAAHLQQYLSSFKHAHKLFYDFVSRAVFVGRCVCTTETKHVGRGDCGRVGNVDRAAGHRFERYPRQRSFVRCDGWGGERGTGCCRGNNNGAADESAVTAAAARVWFPARIMFSGHFSRVYYYSFRVRQWFSTTSTFQTHVHTIVRNMMRPRRRDSWTWHEIPCDSHGLRNGADRWGLVVSSSIYRRRDREESSPKITRLSIFVCWYPRKNQYYKYLPI